MIVTQYSRVNILQTMEQWHVPKDYADPIYNYLVYGWEPGGFFTAVLANDWMGAIRRSHPGNTVDALQYISGWIVEYMPKQCWGSYKKFDDWVNADDDYRREVLEKAGLIFNSKDETWMALQGKPVFEPVLW